MDILRFRQLTLLSALPLLAEFLISRRVRQYTDGTSLQVNKKEEGQVGSVNMLLKCYT